MKTPEDRYLLKISDVARQFGVTTQTVRAWISSGKLPAVRVGERVIRIRPSDLAAMERKIPTVGNLR
jgi:excisionase family DNA binding protein